MATTNTVTLLARSGLGSCRRAYTVAEILKYAVKPSDMIRDHEWFLQLADQLQKTRGVAIGGILKHYIKEREPEKLTAEPGEETPALSAEQLFFGWKREVR